VDDRVRRGYCWNSEIMAGVQSFPLEVQFDIKISTRNLKRGREGEREGGREGDKAIDSDRWGPRYYQAARYRRGGSPQRMELKCTERRKGP